jgi:hypothetical protein
MRAKESNPLGHRMLVYRNLNVQDTLHKQGDFAVVVYHTQSKSSNQGI